MLLLLCLIAVANKIGFDVQRGCSLQASCAVGETDVVQFALHSLSSLGWAACMGTGCLEHSCRSCYVWHFCNLLLSVSQIAQWDVVAGLADSNRRCNFSFLNYILTYTSYLTPPHKQMHSNIICLANDVAAETSTCSMKQLFVLDEWMIITSLFSFSLSFWIKTSLQNHYPCFKQLSILNVTASSGVFSFV